MRIAPGKECNYCESAKIQKHCKSVGRKGEEEMDYDCHEALKLENQLCFPLYAAARDVIARYTPFLKPLGITYTQYLVFLVLWEKDGIPVGEICEKLRLDNGTLSPLLKKMQLQGFIEKHRSEKDDRIVVVSLTAKGKDLFEEAKDIPLKMAGCIKFPPDKAKQLYDLLYELLDLRA